MKLLLIHVDWIEWQAVKRALKTAPDVDTKPARVQEALVAFTAVERDDGNIKEVSQKAVESILDVCKQVKVTNVVLYPYAHLSSELGSPQAAIAALDGMESLLKKQVSVSRAPFGWYKKLSFSAKGHPLSELSRTIKAGESEQKPRAVMGRSKVSREELTENDHRIIGQKLDLYSFQEVAPGMVFMHPKGTVVINQLLGLWKAEHRKRGYHEISTPQIMNKDLWIVSGHWEHYKDHMFFTDIDGAPYAVKPMNCPGAILVYKSSTRSYRDLPLRLAELGKVHRNELSGVLSGLFRLRAFTQDDAHLFVTEGQLGQEIENIVDFVNHIYRLFGFEYHVELSTRPEKFMGKKELWDKAESALEGALKKKKMNYKVKPGDGAFYGPKIDFHIKDSMGRTWQCATCQVDFQMPEKFDLKYTNEHNQESRPVIIHRVIYGAIERFLGILVEHYKGAFPLWLAPTQVKVLSFTDRNSKAAASLANELQTEGFRVELDIRDNTVDYKVRDAEVHKIPYIVVIGDKEEKASTLAVRPLGKKPEFGIKKADFIRKLKEEAHNIK